MKTMIFIQMCECLKGIAHEPEPKRTADLELFMSQGYLFLDLTENQIRQLKQVLSYYFTDLYIVYKDPDENGYTSEFMYLRFK